MKFRKKPVVIEAEQFLPETEPLPFREQRACSLGPDGWYVTTAHGQRTAIVSGDWIISEPDNRGFYPCKPDIFEMTYEPVEESEK